MKLLVLAKIQNANLLKTPIRFQHKVYNAKSITNIGLRARIRLFAVYRDMT